MSVTQQRGMLWGTLGTYRTAVGAGKIILTRARTPARGIQVGGVLRLATELLPNDSLTWHDFVANWQHFPRGGYRTTTDATRFCLPW